MKNNPKFNAALQRYKIDTGIFHGIDLNIRSLPISSAQSLSSSTPSEQPNQTIAKFNIGTAIVPMSISLATVIEEIKNTIIFDGGCSVHSTWDRSLFVGEMEPPPKENLIITDSNIQEILGVGIIKINYWTENGNHELLFKKINWVPSLLTTMISANTLENFGLVRDPATNTLRLGSQLVCHFEEKFGLNIFKLTNPRTRPLEQ